MTTKQDTHTQAHAGPAPAPAPAPAHTPPEVAAATAAPPPLPKTTVAPPEPKVMGRKVVQVAMDPDSHTVLAVCDDGTLWQYPMAGIVPVSSRLWSEMPPILTDAQLQRQAKEAEVPAPSTPPPSAPH